MRGFKIGLVVSHLAILVATTPVTLQSRQSHEMSHGNGGTSRSWVENMMEKIMTDYPIFLPPVQWTFRQITNWFVTEIRAANKVVLPPQLRPNAKRVRVTYGPFEIKSVEAPAAEKAPSRFMPFDHMDPNSVLLLNRVADFCQDCTYLYGKTFISDVNGKVIGLDQGAYNHHIIFQDMGDQTQTETYYNCSQDGGPMKKALTPLKYFLGSGVDDSEYFFTTKDGSFNSGFYRGNTGPMILQSEIVNYTKGTQKWYITVEYEYVDGKPAGLALVSNNNFNVVNCYFMNFNEQTYRIPAGVKRHTKRSPDFVLTEDGTILQGLGHMHDGGDSVSMKINGKEVCEARLQYSDPSQTKGQWPSIQRVLPCEGPIEVYRGDVLSIVAKADLEKHHLRKSGSEEMEMMGEIGVTFAAKSKS